MNPAQRLVLIATAAVFFVVAAVPPWIQEGQGASRQMDRRDWEFIFEPPTASPFYKAAAIDWTILGYELVAVFVTSMILLVAFKGRAKTEPKMPVP